MKKAVSLILVLVLCLSLCACNNVGEAQEAIDALHALTDYSRWTDSYDYGDYLDDFIETLYLTEDGQIHHNEWTLAYQKAKDAYDALSDSEKQQIQNPEWLTKDDYLIWLYEIILVKQEVALFCKEAAVEKLKNNLVNKSSYEEYSWKIGSSSKVERSGSYQKPTDQYTFSIQYIINYSATNRMGGRIDDTEYIYISGTYNNGTITIK